MTSLIRTLHSGPSMYDITINYQANVETRFNHPEFQTQLGGIYDVFYQSPEMACIPAGDGEAMLRIANFLSNSHTLPNGEPRVTPDISHMSERFVHGSLSYDENGNIQYGYMIPFFPYDNPYGSTHSFMLTSIKVVCRTPPNHSDDSDSSDSDSSMESTDEGGMTDSDLFESSNSDSDYFPY